LPGMNSFLKRLLFTEYSRLVMLIIRADEFEFKSLLGY
jgi:hypothetical protein